MRTCQGTRGENRGVLFWGPGTAHFLMEKSRLFRLKKNENLELAEWGKNVSGRRRLSRKYRHSWEMWAVSTRHHDRGEEHGKVLCSSARILFMTSANDWGTLRSHVRCTLLSLIETAINHLIRPFRWGCLWGRGAHAAWFLGLLEGHLILGSSSMYCCAGSWGWRVFLGICQGRYQERYIG